jgi:hypothetical protein
MNRFFLLTTDTNHQGFCATLCKDTLSSKAVANQAASPATPDQWSPESKTSPQAIMGASKIVFKISDLDLTTVGDKHKEFSQQIHR